MLGRLSIRQFCIRLCCSLFNCSSVVILMTVQRRSPGKGLLAVGIGAFVGSLARVYPSVSREGARITEWLQLCQLGKYQESSTSTHFATSLAHVRLLPCVYPHMDSQRRPLNKLFTTARMFALMWTDSTMYPLWCWLERRSQGARSPLPCLAKSLRLANLF